MFSEQLREYRKAAGLTQSELAERLQVHLQTVSKWERGITEPDISLLGELAAALGISLERLVGAEEGEELYGGDFDGVRCGKNLAELRRRRGEHQEDVAALLNTTSDIVSKWERGVICPDLNQLIALARHYALPLSKLYYGIGEEERTEAPVQLRRRVRLSRIRAAGAGALGAAALVLAVVLPLRLSDAFPAAVYTVTADGIRYEVSENEWFTPASAAREGYDFVGYADETGEIVTFPTKVEKSCEYTAVFSPHTYTVDYWLNGGYFTSSPLSAFSVESGAVELLRPQKNGVTFEGWYLTADCSGEAVESIVCTGRDVSVYARWSDGSCTVRYELDGGVMHGDNPASVTGEHAVTLSEPVRSGYDFLGWYDSPTGGRKYTSVGGDGAQNLTLYALWQECGDLRTVLYDLGEGTLEGENPIAVGAGDVHVLSGAKRTGYDFMGWNTSPDGTGEWYEVLYGIREDLKLYAVWSPKHYTVRYELSGGTFCDGVNPNDIVYGTAVELLPVARTGHRFLGWHTQKEKGELVDRIDEQNILRLSVLYARFEALAYSVSLKGAGGTFAWEGEERSEETLLLTFGDKATLPECTRAGHDFLGWYDDAGVRYQAIDVTNIGNVTLTAKYCTSGKTYTVDYELGGGTLSRENPRVVSVGQSIALNEPEREKHLFLGWNDAADGTGTWYTSTPAQRETALLLYAIWQECTVSGSADDFAYSKGLSSVTITGYTGTYGKNIDLVIPSFIDELPVVAVQGEEDGAGMRYLNSLSIPETVVSIGDGCFRDLSVTQPVVIPASVEEIGMECFFSAKLSLSFAQGSSLSAIGERAFASATLQAPLALPEGVERLDVGAFSGAVAEGILLPASLTYISAYALTLTGGSSNIPVKVYLHESIEYIESSAFCETVALYTPLSWEEMQSFAQGFLGGAMLITLEKTSGITLETEGERSELAGQAFLLPSPVREGMTFVGWYDAFLAEYVSPCYIPTRSDVVLQAVFSEASPRDGSTPASCATLTEGMEHTFILRPGVQYYVAPALSSGRVRFTLTAQRMDCPFDTPSLRLTRADDPYAYPVQTGVSVSCAEGEVFCIAPWHTEPYFYSVTVRVDSI